MAEGFDGYEQSNSHDQTRHKVVNSFGTHTNTSSNILDDADTQPTSDTPAALAQIIVGLFQISANQECFKDGLDKLVSERRWLLSRDKLKRSLVQQNNTHIASLIISSSNLILTLIT